MESDRDVEVSMVAARDRVRRARALVMSPGERLAEMWRLIARANDILARHPAGLDHFRRRNFHARAVRRPGEGRCDDA